MHKPAVGIVLDAGVELRVLDESTFSDAVEANVRRAWDEENAARERPLVDNPLLSFVGVSGSTVWGRLLRYRHFIAWRRDPALLGGERVAAMGVSGLTLVDGRPALGRRGAHMTSYPGWWELLPSGSIDTEFLGDDGRIDFVAALAAELEQETGLAGPLVRSIRPYALVYDPNIETYDIVARIEAASTPDLRERWRHLNEDDEYSRIETVAHDELAGFLARHRGLMIAPSLAMLEDAVLREAAGL